MQKPKPFKLLSTGLPSLFILTALGCTACSSIYVGNVNFKAAEICSKEYSDPWHWNSGCLPPARAANAQRFFFERYRPLISGSEVATLDNAAASGITASADINLLPSIVGRIFRAQENQGMVVVPDSRGNMEFLTADAGNKSLSTELQVSTDLSGIIQKKVSAGVEFDPVQVLNAALKANGITLPIDLQNKLVTQIEYAHSSRDASSGSYYYVSISPDKVDELVTKLRENKKILSQSPDNAEVKDDQFWQFWHRYDTTSGIPSFTNTVSNVSAMSSVSDITGTDKTAVYGLIIGAAIIRTKAGHSSLCGQFGLGIGVGAGNASNCDDLRATLEDAFKTEKPAINQAAASAAPAPAVLAASDQNAATKTNKMLKSISIAYTKAVYKELDVNDHASVLAIQWIPLSLTKTATTP